MIDVNQVYTTVLFILNKEQRGYMTPAEFNSVATQVQLEIFENYFEELNVNLRGPQNSDEFADRINNLEEKISLFNRTTSYTTNPFTLLSAATNVNRVHRLGVVSYQNPLGDSVEIERVTWKDFNLITRSNLTQPSTAFPIYKQAGNVINVFPPTLDLGQYNVDYVVKPLDPKWNYSIGGSGQYTYQQTGSQDFEISTQDKVELILGILKYAGVIIRDPSIFQQANVMEQADSLIEKS